MTVGDRIKQRRLDLELSQTELAKRAGYKSKSDISKMENAGNEIGMARIKKIADALNVSPSYLMGWDKEAQEVIDHVRSSLRRVDEGTEKESESGAKYYFDDESAAYADFLHKNPDYKVLFDASRKVKPEDIDFVAKMIERTANYDD